MDIVSTDTPSLENLLDIQWVLRTLPGAHTGSLLRYQSAIQEAEKMGRVEEWKASGDLNSATWKRVVRMEARREGFNKKHFPMEVTQVNFLTYVVPKDESLKKEREDLDKEVEEEKKRYFSVYDKFKKMRRDFLLGEFKKIA